MQRILFTCLALVTIATNVFATSPPGEVTFAAGTGETGTVNEITYSTDGITTTAYPVSPGLPSYGAGNIGFYTAAAGTILDLAAGLPDFTAWTPLNITPVAVGSGPTGAGSGFATLSLPIPAGNNIELEVVAWSGAYTSWSAAVASGTALIGFSGETFNGSRIGALGWSQPTTDGVSNPPANLVTGQNGFEGIVMTPIPEPSIYALAGLAAGALLLCRRLSHRKSPAFAR
jgi:hypothetical protein